MRKIAADFSAFAGARKADPKVCELSKVVEEVLEMHAAWALEAKVEVRKSLVRGLAQLRTEVAQRAALTAQRFTVEDLDDIAEYLNRSHYRFEK